MKNIRILEDGNRLIVVLEGYDKSAIGALMEVLGTASSPLEHIRPHTGETQFQLKGTEKVVQMPSQSGPPIQPPAFVSKVLAEETAPRRGQKPAATRPATEQNTEPAQAAEAATPTAPKAAKPTQAAELKTPSNTSVQAGTASRTVAVKTSQVVKPVERADLAKAAESAHVKTMQTKPATPTAAKKATTERMDTKAPEKAVPTAEPAARTSEPAPMPLPKMPAKPIEVMTSFELKEIIRQADRKQLAVIAKRIGAYSTVTSILNADTRTLREFVKRLRTA